IDIKVSSGNADEILIANSSFWQSKDGGKTFKAVPWGGDTHDIWIDPKNPDSFALTDDAGAHITLNHGKSFTQVSLPNGQMYHVAVDDQVPYWIYSNRQDNSFPMRGASDAPIRNFERRRPEPPTDSTHADSMRTDSTIRRGAARDTMAGEGRRRPSVASENPEIPPESFGNVYSRTPWENGLGGCESGFTLPDKSDTDIVWASCYGNEVTRYDARTKLARSVSPWIHTLDSPPDKVKYRCHWTPPLAIDPFNTKTVYYGCQVIFRTSDAGQHWTVISPDLSTRDSSRIVSSGGLVADNLGQFYGEVVFAIAPSEIKRGLIWAGTNDGQLWYTPDAGAHWNNVTANMKGLPAWGTIRKIEPSHFDPATAYVAIDFHIMDNRKPYIYKTTDYGHTWTNITSDLPSDHPLAYVMSITENPNRKGMLFAGTGNAFYYSLNDGAHWTKFNSGLPAAPVTWIAAPKRWNDVVVSTYGRGLYILRDVTALGQGASAAPGAAPAAPRLFTPHLAFRQSRSGRADFTFELPRAQDSIGVELLDASGAPIRTFHLRARPGLNRVPWDLRYDAAPQVVLRTVAPDNPHIFADPRFAGKSTRPVLHWGIEAPVRTGPIASPGKYSVRLTVAGKSWTQPFEVIRDPAMPSPTADLVASTQTQVRIRNDMTDAVNMINHIESMRKTIADQRASNTGKSDVIAALDRLNDQMLGVELQLLTRSDMESDDKYYVEPFAVYMNLVWLSGEVGSGAGDVAGGADYRPTAASLAVLSGIEQALTTARTSYANLIGTEIPAFNAAMRGRVPAIVAPSVPRR